jgi:excisionase family DNA binding protein
MGLPQLMLGEPMLTTATGLPIRLSVDQTAQILGMHRSSVIRSINRAELPHVRIGRSYWIPTAKLVEMWGLTSDQVKLAQSDDANRGEVA